MGNQISEIEELPKNIPHSPLRYPGGKNRAIKAIYSLIPKSENVLCSPFLGGASIELACTTRMKVYGSDIFEPLIAFWREILSEPARLAMHVRNYYPLEKSRFYQLQRSYLEIKDQTERAAAFYVLNRSSFSGTTLSGGMSPDHPRFTESAIKRVENFRADNLIVECEDFQDAIEKREDAFLYLDPPYLNGQALYGVKGDTHKEFDYKRLAEILKKRDRWIMSYNDCEEIRTIYKRYPIISIKWIYGMSKDKNSNEILILSREFQNASFTK